MSPSVMVALLDVFLILFRTQWSSMAQLNKQYYTTQYYTTTLLIHLRNSLVMFVVDHGINIGTDIDTFLCLKSNL